MLRHRLIGAGLGLLSATGLTRLLPAADDARGFVLTLHHVRPETRRGFSPNAGLSVTPDFLDRFLGALAAGGWEFLSLADLLAAEPDPAARRVAITLDDGYRNNIEHAAPVFRKWKSPYTIFVCPGFCDRTAELWWEALERIIAGMETVDAPGEPDGRLLRARSPAEKQVAFMRWRRYLTEEVDETVQRREIRALADRRGLSLPDLARELVMDWDEVRAAAADPLCAIGAHTLTHPALARLPAASALAEMRASADRIAEEAGERPRHIAFPYGYRSAAGEREAHLAHEAGFGASFTTRPGLVRSGSDHGLPRISVNGLHQSVRRMQALLDPGVWTARDRVFGPPL